MCSLSLFFQPEDEPVLVESAIIVADISISEGVLAELVPSVEVVFAEVGIFAERKNNAIVDAPTEKFPLKLILLQTQGFLPLLHPWGMFPHTEITTLMVEVVPAEEKASIEEEVLEGLGSATGGTFAEATTPLKDGASPIGPT